MRIDFWTSTEYSGFMESLISELNALGHEARQRFLISEASYRAAKSRPQRLWLRLRQYLLYPAHLKGSLLFGKKADVVVVCTNTFYAPLLATFLHKRVIHLVYDLFPEAMRGEAALECGSVGRNDQSCRFGGEEAKLRGGLLPRLIRTIVRHTLRRAEANVFLGDHLRDYVLSQYPDVRNPVVIPVGAIDLWNNECGDRNSAVPAVKPLPNKNKTHAADPTGAPISASAGAKGGGDNRDEVNTNIEHQTNDEPKTSTLCPPSSTLPPSHIRVHPCPSVVEPSSSTLHPPPSDPRVPRGKLSLLYCGNLGRMHDIDTLLTALSSFDIQTPSSSPLPTQASSPELAPSTQTASPSDPSTSCNPVQIPTASQSPIRVHPCSSVVESPPPPVSRIPYPVSAREARFLFHCSGPKKPQLEAAVAALPPEIRARIHIGGSLAPADWQRVMQEADIALVTMIPGAENVVMPSKTYSAMMAGQAILAICPDPSDLADTIRRADCGWVIPPGDAPALLQALHEAQTQPDALARKQQNARATALQHYSMPVLARRWEELLFS